jgi:hypothetical protein
VIRFLAPALVMFPLLGVVPTELATAATIGHAPLINLAENRAIADQGAIQPVYWVCNGWGHCWWRHDHYWWHHHWY